MRRAGGAGCEQLQLRQQNGKPMLQRTVLMRMGRADCHKRGPTETSQHRRKLCPSTARARQLNPASDAHFPAACNYGGPSGARRRPRHRPPYSVAASPSRPWGDGRLTFLFFDMLLSIAAMVTGERLVLLARGEREKSGKPRLQSILSYNRRLFALSPETFEENVHFGSWGA